MVTKFKFATGEEYEVESWEFQNDCMSLEVTFILGTHTLAELTAVVKNSNSIKSIHMLKYDNDDLIGEGGFCDYWGSRTVIGTPTDNKVNVTLNRIDYERDSLVKQALMDFIAMETGVDLDE